MNFIKSLIDKYIKNSDFTRNSLILMIGTIVAQVISLIAAPILSRIYTPEQYGILGIFNSISSLLNSILIFGFNSAIVLAPTKKRRLNIVALNFIIAISNFIILSIIFIFISNPISILYKRSELSFFLYFVPLESFLFCSLAILTSYTNKIKRYRSLSTAKIMQASTNTLSNIGFGLLKFGTIGLILGGFFGYIISIIKLLPKLVGELIKNRRYITKNTMIGEAKKYRSIAFTTSFNSLSTILKDVLFIYLISFFFDTKTIGLYSFAYRIMALPITIIATTLQHTFYQKITEIFSTTGNIRPMTSKLISRMAMFSFPFFLIIFLLAPQIFSFIFGLNWYQAGIYSRALAPYLFSYFIFMPIAVTPIVVRKEKKYLLLVQINNILMIVSVLFGGIIKKDFLYTCYFLSTVNAAFLIFIVAWIYKISKIKGKNYIDS